MFNISDIFDKYKKAQSPQSSEAKDEAISISSVVGKKLEEKNEGAASRLYEGVVRQVKEIYILAREDKLRSISDIQRLSQELVVFLQQEDAGLLKICFSAYPKLEDYLYYHVVNVCILAFKMASGEDTEQEKRIELAVSCLLHDIGLVRNLEIILKTRALTREEYANIKQHPQAGFEILSKVDPKLSSAVLEVAFQEHERIDGSGYPRGLAENEIALNAKIVGLADCFEALTHPRPYRKKYPAREASKIIVDNKNSFEIKWIKALLGKIGIFPVGTPVRLNTKELGVVLGTSEVSPLRPVVKILYDVDGNELKEPRVVDLSNNKVLFIAESI
jgi:HD-GYP domain-containing protein (c-di-GMP phosphodiesterase class II)